MELYERVRSLSRALAGSDKALAEMLGIKQNTFSGYLKPERQDNLWPLLPRMLALFPCLSRNWLYFEEGPMTMGSEGPLDEAVPASPAAAAEQTQRRQELEAQLVSLKDALQERDEALAEARTKLAEKDEELRDERRLNRQLITKLLIDGAGDKDAASDIGAVGSGGRQ